MADMPHAAPSDDGFHVLADTSSRSHVVAFRDSEGWWLPGVPSPFAVTEVAMLDGRYAHGRFHQVSAVAMPVSSYPGWRISHGLFL